MSSVTTIAMPNRYASFGSHSPLLTAGFSTATARDTLPSPQAPIQSQRPDLAPATIAVEVDPHARP